MERLSQNEGCVARNTTAFTECRALYVSTPLYERDVYYPFDLKSTRSSIKEWLDIETTKKKEFPFQSIRFRLPAVFFCLFFVKEEILMYVTRAEIRVIVITYDREIVRNTDSDVPCPRGSTCECPQTREHIRKVLWEKPLPACSPKTCPAWSLHALALWKHRDRRSRCFSFVQYWIVYCHFK